METYPKHIFDNVFWPVLQVIWEPFSKKRSHWWHWQETPLLPNLLDAGLIVPGYSGSKIRKNFLSNLWQTNFGWKGVAIISPTDYQGKYRVGYREFSESGCRSEVCSIVLSDKVAVLRGPKNVVYFALSYPDNQILSLSLSICTLKSRVTSNII